MSAGLPYFSFDSTFDPGIRVEIVTSTGFGTVTGRILKQIDHWLVLEQPANRTVWVALTHVVTIHKTEEQ